MSGSGRPPALLSMIEAATKRPRTLAVEFPTGQTVDLGGLWRDAECVGAELLRTHGPGAHVAGLLTASRPAVTWLLGAWRAGLDVVSVPLPARASNPIDFMTHVGGILGAVGAQGIYAGESILPLLPDGIGLNFPTVDPRTSTLPICEPGSLLQFTSGSSGAPTGVRVTQEALGFNVHSVLTTIAPRPGYHAYSWLPLSHDMGLVGMLLTSLAAGGEEWTDGEGQLVLRLPEQYLSKPSSWLAECSAYRANVTAVPPTALEVSSKGPPGRGHLDLSSMDCCIVGGDTVRAGALASFAEFYEGSGLRPEALCPAYGLAEATLAVTLHPRSEPWASVEVNGDQHVSCGPALDGVLVVADDGGGQISVASPSLAKSVVTPDGETPMVLEKGHLLVTSDRGFLDDRGHLHVVGRKADQIVVRSRTLRPELLEAYAETCGFRPGNLAVVQLDDGRVVAAGEPAERCNTGELVRSLLRNHEVRLSDVHVVARGELPKTFSGKLRRELIRQEIASGKYG